MSGIWERKIISAKNVLADLTKTHGKSLDDESLRTLMTEVEAVINLRPSNVETVSDSSSLFPISPSNKLRIKTSIVMPPPGTFQGADLYCKKKWRRVQHIINDFWSRWRKEFLTSLQTRMEWNETRRNFKVGDMVPLKNEHSRNQWSMARVVQTEPNKNGTVRSVILKLILNTKSSKRLRRPISKLILVIADNEN